ncbi:MAG: threonine synthase, partial [Clostridia bacterium]|nr:threonine synthase [Clostridia bacterium]
LALQLLPFLLTTSAKKVSGGKKIVILVATSGDTGKAALEGFCDVENTEIMVFYPSDGVSPMQKLQMDSQKGENVHVCAIKGNFDDAQTGVKKIFTDNAVKEKLAENNMQFSSANSINWGRLAPQIVYYVSAYCDMLERGDDYLKDGFNIVVPTGNFGNILAAYYAKKMGVPVNKLICASNANNVLTDFINTGKYDRNRKFFTTISPSMDILISSNLERMLFELSGNDDKAVAKMQNDLSESGIFTVSEEIKAKMNDLFYGGCCDDEATLETIKELFAEYGYLCDTHTAVAMKVYKQYVTETGDDRPTVIASTASPYKFANSVLSAVSDKKADTEFDTVKLLSSETKTKIPAPIKALETAEVRFKNLCEKEEMLSAVYKALGI